MLIQVVDRLGDKIEFDCPPGFASRWTVNEILAGRTYPILPFVDDVDVIWDVGANCGATSVHLARTYPDARIYAFEPGAQALAYLRRNVDDLPNVVVQPIGLSDADEVARLHLHADDIGQSTVRGDGNGQGFEEVALRSAGAWAAEHGIDSIDVLKVDVEGCELAVLRSLEPLLDTVKVIYVEYETRGHRREIDALLAPTHELYFAMMLALDQGEVVYLHRDLVDQPEAATWWKEHLLSGRKI